MILLISGASHTGKTCLAQKLLETLHIPYLSIDHLKMGLIRSGICPLSPESEDDQLTAFLWPVVREIVKTNVENGQNLIVEGCYIPENFREDFEERYLKQIHYLCLVFDEKYIEQNFDLIKQYASCVEERGEEPFLDEAWVKEDNAAFLERCRKYGCEYLLVKDTYSVWEQTEAWLEREGIKAEADDRNLQQFSCGSMENPVS